MLEVERAAGAGQRKKGRGGREEQEGRSNASEAEGKWEGHGWIMQLPKSSARGAGEKSETGLIGGRAEGLEGRVSQQQSRLCPRGSKATRLPSFPLTLQPHPLLHHCPPCPSKSAPSTAKQTAPER